MTAGADSCLSASDQWLSSLPLAATPQTGHNLRMESDPKKPVSYEPFGYGNRWYDRTPRRRRPATVIIGTAIGILLLVNMIWGR